MTTDYEQIYRDTPHALGAPNAEVAAFISGLAGPLDILDVGCGQGRDALPLARAGHRVHGIDLSPTGIAQMVQEARREHLPLTGDVANLLDYTPDRQVDVLLIDRTLHMIPDASTRCTILVRLLGAVRPGGWLLLLDEPSNMADFAAVLKADERRWRAEFEGRIRDKDRPVTGTLFARAED